MKRALVAVLLAASACDHGFKPETLVDGLRVLGVRSTPADLAPGDTAALEGLIVDPSRPDGGTTTLWLGCDPDPYNENRSSCSDPSLLQDPGNFAGADGGLPPGVTLLGLGAKATLATKATLFDVFPAGDARRVSGTVAQVIAFAVAAQVPANATPSDFQDLMAKVRSKELASLLTLYRIRVSEDPQRNHNPVFQHLLVNGRPWPDGAHLVLKEQEHVPVDVDVPDSAFEAFTNATPNGVEQKTERILAAWFSTSGRFSEARTALREGVKTAFTGAGGAGDSVPSDRTGSMWIVLRDTRGGQAWREVPFVLCSPGLPTPSITAVRAPSNPVFPVTLDGEHLEYVVDVVIHNDALPSGVALTGGGINPATGLWEAPMPKVPSGTYRVDVLSRSCGQHATGQVLTVP